MLKFTISVKQNKDNDDCTVKVEQPKNLDKASESEKAVTQAVYQTILASLENLQQHK